MYKMKSKFTKEGGKYYWRLVGCQETRQAHAHCTGNLVVEDSAAGAMEEQQSLQALEFTFVVQKHTRK